MRILKKIIIAIGLFSLTSCMNTMNPPESETQVASTITSEYIQEPITPDYIKLTPKEAQSMMTGDVIILDVRTQDEYNEGHIINAILLPNNEIREKAETVIPNKDQTILVYCRTGERSETATKELMAAGYTSVFDFGGIVDWTGEIIQDDINIVCYNYFGDILPEEIITPFEYSASIIINSEMPEFDFTIEGTIIEEYNVIDNESIYYIVGEK